MQPVFRGKHFWLDVEYFIVKATNVGFDKIPLNPWIQQIVDNGKHMTDYEWLEQLILSTKCFGELTRGLMSLICWPGQMILWFQKIMMIFIWVYGSKWPPPPVWWCQFEPQGHGRQDLRSEPLCIATY